MKSFVKLEERSILIGIDEAGRGPLAGPVAVGAFAIKSRYVLRMFRGVKDSKRLSEKQREVWFRLINTCKKDGTAMYAVSFSRSGTIDARGISYAVFSALNRCLMRLEKKAFAFPRSRVLMDGLLSASSRYIDQKTIIGGDDTVPVIALASICAKVLRDRKMVKLAKENPQYGFDKHKGYGTKEHYLAIRKHGVLPVHRKSYLKSFYNT